MASLVYGTLTRLFGNISFRNCNSLTQYAKIATEATTSTSTDGKLENETKEQQQSNQFRDQINAGVYGRALFPTVDTHTNLVIDSVPFKNLHILHIKSSKNNTILSVTDNLGKVLFLTSSGSNGFKNAKKSTTTAAQAAALTMSDFLKRRHISNVRVVLKGIGNGRAAAVKSLQMSDISIVSLTDNTLIPLPYTKPLRPQKQRRV